MPLGGGGGVLIGAITSQTLVVVTTHINHPFLLVSTREPFEQWQVNRGGRMEEELLRAALVLSHTHSWQPCASR